MGRRAALCALLAEPWDSLVEYGLGTGSNLHYLQQKRRTARFGGLDASDAMLSGARRRLPEVRLLRAFAEEADVRALLGESPEIALFSYSLTMMEDPEAALAAARAQVSRAVWVVDFGPHQGWPGLLGAALDAWLSAFRVRPLTAGMLARARWVRPLAGGYAVIAVFSPFSGEEAHGKRGDDGEIAGYLGA